MSFLLRLTSSLTGRKVGTDRFGTVYFESRAKQAIYNRTRRWAIFPGRDPRRGAAGMARLAAPHGGRAVVRDEALPLAAHHQPNLTGTALAYRPAGHDYVGGNRHLTGGDYEAWTPGA